MGGTQGSFGAGERTWGWKAKAELFGAVGEFWGWEAKQGQEILGRISFRSGKVVMGSGCCAELLGGDAGLEVMQRAFSISPNAAAAAAHRWELGWGEGRFWL